MQTTRSIKVFIADDHPLLRAGLRVSLNQQAGLQIVGEADDGFSAVEKIQADPPDLALIDFDMPGLAGVGAIRILRKALPSMKIVVLTTYKDEAYVHESMEAGADGYVLKMVRVEELANIIKSIYAGESMFSPYLLNLTVGKKKKEVEKYEIKNTQLTLREKEIMTCIAEGMGNRKISEKLFISTETVKTHVKNIFKKLEVKNRVEAIMAARNKKIVSVQISKPSKEKSPRRHLVY